MTETPRSTHQSDVFDYPNPANPETELWAANCDDCPWSSSGHQYPDQAVRVANRHWDQHNRWAQP